MLRTDGQGQNTPMFQVLANWDKRGTERGFRPMWDVSMRGWCAVLNASMIWVIAEGGRADGPIGFMDNALGDDGGGKEGMRDSIVSRRAQRYTGPFGSLSAILRLRRMDASMTAAWLISCVKRIYWRTIEGWSGMSVVVLAWA